MNGQDIVRESGRVLRAMPRGVSLASSWSDGRIVDRCDRFLAIGPVGNGVESRQSRID
jgi:hypothetical protein